MTSPTAGGPVHGHRELHVTRRQSGNIRIGAALFRRLGHEHADRQQHDRARERSKEDRSPGPVYRVHLRSAFLPPDEECSPPPSSVSAGGRGGPRSAVRVGRPDVRHVSASTTARSRSRTRSQRCTADLRNTCVSADLRLRRTGARPSEPSERYARCGAVQAGSGIRTRDMCRRRGRRCHRQASLPSGQRCGIHGARRVPLKHVQPRDAPRPECTATNQSRRPGAGVERPRPSPDSRDLRIVVDDGNARLAHYSSRGKVMALHRLPDFVESQHCPERAGKGSPSVRGLADESGEPFSGSISAVLYVDLVLLNRDAVLLQMGAGGRPESHGAIDHVKWPSWHGESTMSGSSTRRSRRAAGCVRSCRRPLHSCRLLRRSDARAKPTCGQAVSSVVPAEAGRRQLAGLLWAG